MASGTTAVVFDRLTGPSATVRLKLPLFAAEPARTKVPVPYLVIVWAEVAVTVPLIVTRPEASIRTTPPPAPAGLAWRTPPPLPGRIGSIVES